MSDSLQALRRANPRAKAGFREAVDAAAAVVLARVAREAALPTPVHPTARRHRRATAVLAGAALVVAIAAVTLTTAGWPGGGPTGADAAAAVRKAAGVTAESADRSGVAVVRMTHAGRSWGGTTIRWHREDISIVGAGPQRRREPGSAVSTRKTGQELRVVDGTLYGVEPNLGWVRFGSPASIDPDSGTTPTDYLAAVREDVGGETLRRVTNGMSALATRELSDGSTIYSGGLRAGLIARETGFKEGQAIRVFPFGYVAHGEAADPANRLDAAVTVGPDGVVRRIALTWGSPGSAWTYAVTYSGLGITPAPVVPEGARSLKAMRNVARSTGR
jgi:hypothetical protein